jgi:hypothetical protein
MTQTNKKGRKAPKKLTPYEVLEESNVKLRESGYELVLRRIPTKDVVAFDFGLVFTKDTTEVGLYVDDDLRDALTHLASKHGQVLIKANWFSPDVVVVTPAENPDPLQNTPDTDTAKDALEALSEPR